MTSNYTPSNPFRRVKSALKNKRFLLYLVSATFCWLLIVYAKCLYEPSTMLIHLPDSTGAEVEGSVKYEFTINQPGCRIPSMSAFGPSITAFLKPMPPAPCEFGPQAEDPGRENKRFPAVVVDDVSSLRIDYSSLKYYDRTNISCSYSSFHRPIADGQSSADAANIDDETVSSGVVEQLNADGPTNITSETDEFVQVTCADALSSKKRTEAPFYRDYFALVPKKKEVERRCRRIDRRLSLLDNQRVNIVVLGLDALSRLNFQRQMPTSYEYLLEQMAAIEMYGYNKVGDNTFPNLVPLLMGKSVEELQEICWNSSSTFDGCPFVWNRLPGYRTIFAEDSPNLAVFNYFRKGFRRQPTDYYLRPFYVEAEKEIGFYMPGNSPLCLGPRLSLSVVLNYAYKHVRVWNKGRRFFGFFWTTSFTHDTFNLNTEGDATLRLFLERYRRAEGSNDTILIVTSDHGMRWGAFRETYQGRLEERLPLLMFVLPDWFEREYPRAVTNLRLNQARLTTPFDLHDTFTDLSHLTRAIRDDAIDTREAKVASSRGRSLFLPIDVNRTCDTAGVPSAYCTCRDDSRKLAANDERSIAAADAIVTHLNGLLEDVRECAPLAIDKVVQITAETVSGGRGGDALPRKNSTSVAVSLLVVTVRLRPGGGLFEGTLKYHDSARRYELVGQVSRINEYGSQSFCVNDSTLKLYCYCLH